MASVNNSRQIDHKTMRLIIGLIALLLSPLVYYLSGQGSELGSISGSYWTDAQDVFVGSLFAIGFFLSAYNGTGNGRDWEYFLSKIGCVFAVIVALFPTRNKGSNGDLAPAWVRAVADTLGTTPSLIHQIAAVLLFVCLIAMMWFFSNRARRKGAVGRAYAYRFIAITMVVGIIGIYAVDQWLKDIGEHIFLIEFWGLTWFGAGWFLAGCYRSSTK